MWHISEAVKIISGQSDHTTILASLLAGMSLEDNPRCDILLSFNGALKLNLAGFLVTAKDQPDRLIAYCPMPHWISSRQEGWPAELMRQFQIAIRVAQNPDESDVVDAIWLGATGADSQQVPYWIYGLSCIPLVANWDGNFVHPRPFCPSLFAHMAERPEALEWIKRRQAPFIR